MGEKWGNGEMWKWRNGKWKNRGKTMSKANGIHRKPQRRNEKQTVRPAFLEAPLDFLPFFLCRFASYFVSWQSKDLRKSEILNGI